MAFGFSLRHFQEYNTGLADGRQFLAIALEAAKKLDWEITHATDAGFTALTPASFVAGRERVRVQPASEKAAIQSESVGFQLNGYGRNKRNVALLLATCEQLKNDYSAEDLVAKGEAYEAGNPADEEDEGHRPPLNAREKLSEAVSFFRPAEGYFITPILLIVNVLIFIAMVISGAGLFMPEAETLLQWGANYLPLTADGQAWRLLSSCFIHIGIFHLLMNMFALVSIGLLLEPQIGKGRLLAAYLLSGLAGSLASFWWGDMVISAGASGAIFGLYGVFLALLTTNLIDKNVRKSLLTSVIVFVGYNILYGLKPDSGIDNAAHIGGLLAGIIAGYSFMPGLQKTEDLRLKLVPIGGLAAIMLIASFAVLSGTSKNLARYEAAMEKFVSLESMALEVLNMSPYTPEETILNDLENRGIYYWKESIRLIDSMKKTNLPTPLKQRNLRLREYCQLRIESYRLIYKAVAEKTNAYDNEIQATSARIEKLIAELTGT